MEGTQFQKIQTWFETLNSKADALDLKFENRFNMLMTALTNLDKRVREYIDQNDREISMIKRVIHDMEQEIRQLREQVPS